MKYLWGAQFDDGEEFRQPTDDASKLRPDKSSKFDFLQLREGRRVERAWLRGPHDVVAFADGRFAVDGRIVQPGDGLPDDLQWVEGDPAQGEYFRRVTRDARSGELLGLLFCIGAAPARPGVLNFLAAR